jgi:hypothetical protein
MLQIFLIHFNWILQQITLIFIKKIHIYIWTHYILNDIWSTLNQKKEKIMKIWYFFQKNENSSDNVIENISIGHIHNIQKIIII